tara:strand:+ start:4516 stop:4737 length:222 start_codon:yes stop_codon:yes gene_type:complete
MKSKNYLTYLNDNYFFEVGYLKKESKLKNLQMKKQYNQGRSPRQEEQTYQTLKLAFILFVITISAYGFVSIWM